MIAFPDDEAVHVALAWLRSNEGDGGEADACRAVADWLEDQATQRMLRSEARRAGVPLAMLRKRLAERARQEDRK